MYPAIAIEVQDALGARGYGLDMSLGCSAATGADDHGAVNRGAAAAQAQCALVVVPELTTGAHELARARQPLHLRRRRPSRSSSSRAIEREAGLVGDRVDADDVEVLEQHPQQRSATLIVAAIPIDGRATIDKLFHQHGRRVFKDVVPLAAKFITEHLAAHNLTPAQVSRYWLHQANQKLNELVAQYVIGHHPSRAEAPIILDEYGNTASPAR